MRVMKLSPVRHPRRLLPWVIVVGTVFFLAYQMLLWLPDDGHHPGVVDWGAGQASPTRDVSWNEEVALHFTGRSLWLLAALEPRDSDPAGVAPALLALWWHGLWTGHDAERELVNLLAEAVTDGVSLSGLATAAAEAHMLGDDRRARHWLDLALAHQPQPDPGSDLELARLWLSDIEPPLATVDGAPGQADIMAALAGQLERLPAPGPGEPRHVPLWRLTALKELLARWGGPEHAEAAGRVDALMEDSRSHWRERLILFGAHDGLLILAGLLSLLLVWRWWIGRGPPPHVAPRQERRFARSRIVQAWGLTGTWGWFVWISLMALAVLLVAAAIGLVPGDPPVVALLLWQLVTLLLTLWAFRLANGPGLRLVGLWPPPSGAGRCAAMVLSGLAVLSIIHLGHVIMDPSITLAKLHDIYTNVSLVRGTDGRWIDPLGDLLSAVVLAAVMEELLHRGVIYRVLRQRFGIGIGMLSSSVLFAVLHYYSVFGLVSVFLSGLVFAWVYERTRSLWPPILLHALLNWTITTQMWVLWGGGEW